MVIENRLRFAPARTSIIGKISPHTAIWPAIRLDLRAPTR
jgi:hypothetical protein